MTIALLILLHLLAFIAGGLLVAGALRVPRWIKLRRRTNDETPSEPGFFVEIDCRACSQFNRVPGHRLLDQPRCGHCKVRLMPGRRVVLHRVSPMSASLGRELDTVWRDENRLWSCLAAHVALETKAGAGEQAAPPQRAS